MGDSSGVGAPLDLTIADPGAVNWTVDGLEITGNTEITSGGPATKINTAVAASGELTIEAWIIPGNVTQDGPARVVNVGVDSQNRNAMLGQGGYSSFPDDAFAARVRSQSSTDNGNPILFSPAGTATTNLTHVVLTRAVDGTRVLYVDGVPTNSNVVGGDTSNWNLAYPLLLANENDGSRPWAGTLCQVAIYDVALTAGEVAANEAAGCDGPAVNPTASATVTINDGSEAILSASTFGGDSIVITNTSTFGLELDEVTIDLSTALYPDVLFDPLGSAGDALAKCLEPNAGDAAAVGFVAPVDPCDDPFGGARDGGFETITIQATDWDPGESLALSVDIDPTSIQGVPGAGNSGAVSGFELSGSTVTMTFADASQLVDELIVQPTADADNGIADGAGQLLAPNLGTGPSIDVPSVILGPTVFTNGATAGLTTDDVVDVVVTGLPNTDVVLYVTESGSDVDPGFDPDPFEANKAEDIVAYAATLDGAGTATISIALDDLVQEPLVGDPIDLYYLMAAYEDGAALSDPSDFVYLRKVDSKLPLITPLDDVTVAADETLVVDVAAVDPNGDLFTLALGSTPDIEALGAVFTDNTDGTGQLTWTPALADLGTYTVTITADDASGQSVEAFNITVVDGPQAAATVVIHGGSENLPGTSTFQPGSIAVTNTSTLGLELDQVSIDISTALYPDIVFDPSGAAGNALGKCFEPDATSASVVGLVAPVDPCIDPFGAPREGGYETLTFQANDWQPGETIVFAVDTDPLSNQGLAVNGNSGEVSGFELSGSIVTLTFSDATELVGELFVQSSGDADNGINDAAGQLVAPNLGAGPSIDVPSVALGATVFANGATAGLTTADTVDVVITGDPNADVVLYVVESGYDLDPGFQPDPFEANKAEDVVAYPATLDGAGAATVTISLDDLVQEPLVADPVDLYYLMAAYEAVGAASDPSNFVYLQKVDSTAPVFTPIADVTVNAGDPVNIDITAVDPNGDPITLDIVSSPDIEALGAVLTDDADGTGDIAWATQVSDTGVYAVTVSATADGETTDEVVTITVLPADATALFRVNAGGPEVPAADGSSPAWSSDTSGSPSQYLVAGPASGVFDTTNAIDLTDPSVPPQAPGALFQTERFVDSAETSLEWAFPASSGNTYLVNVYFAEIFTTGQNPIDTVGERVFDVTLEDETILDALDVFDEVGTDAGIMRSFEVALADDTINLELVSDVQNAAIKGIEIIDLGATNIVASGNITATPDPLVLDDSTPTGTVTIANDAAPGTPAIRVASVDITGADAGVFGVSNGGPIYVGPSDSVEVTVTYSGTAVGPFTADLEVAHDGANASPQTIELTGTGDTSPGVGQVLARINSGGPLLAAVDGGPDWEADNGAGNHPFLSDVGSDGESGFAGNDPGPTVPASVPGAVFDTERFSTGGFAYSIPAPAGTQVYVNLYLGNGFGGTSGVGDRVYDISIDGAVVEDDLDLVDTFGHQVGGLLQYLVVSDGSVDIAFSNVVENPLVNAVEVVVAESQPGVLAATPTEVDFGAVAVGSNPSATITLNNLGFEVGDPAITITDVSVTGSEFSTDAVTPIVLPVNGSDSFEVTFSAASATAATGSVTITHDGANSPITIDLDGVATTNVPVSFSKTNLQGEISNNPTSLDWGPDGRLYVAQQNGTIYAYTVSRDGAAPGSGTFTVTATEAILDVKNLPNHNDDGSLAPGQTNRQVTGLIAEGTATNPVLYVSSSDPRIGAGGSGNDTGLDTNSGVVSRLTWNGADWDLLNLVQGLPRSEENHATNGLQLSPDGNTLYVQSGGHTNQGGKSNNFAFTPEYALSASILSIDLAAIGENTYNLPTLGTAGSVAPGNVVGNPDPFGGADGANMAIFDVAGPVDIWSTGWRNGYDLVLTEDGFLFATDNGPNGGWGGPPTGEGVNNTCTDVEVGTGNTQNDQLHYVPFGYHAGHANPTQGNPTIFPGAVRGTPPFSLDQACDYVPAGTNATPGPGGGLAVIGGSTNGITEYTASNFGGALQGDLLMTTFGSSVYRAKRDGAGTGLVDLGDGGTTGPEQLFFSGLGGPLDIVAVGDDGLFPGIIVVAEFGSDSIVFFEPNDFGISCTGAYDPAIDEDADGYSNADEIDNGTDPCNGGDTPADQDGDGVSDLNDNDDDNDGITDDVDTFALDPDNGLTTTAPLLYTFEQSSVAGSPVIFNGLGFTGLMTNGQDWESNWDGSENVKLGGAASILTIVDTPPGDAFETPNDQLNALQFGVDPASLTGETTVRSLVLEPFPAGFTPANFQSAGIFIGPGDQDNYLKLVVNAGGGTGGVQMGIEEAGSFTSVANPAVPSVVGSAQNTELQLVIDPVTGSVEGFYDTGGGLTSVGTTTIPLDWLDGPEALAIGVISTSFNSGSFGTADPFAVGWEEIEVLVAAAPTNTAPAITSAGSTSVGEGDALSFFVTATDADLDPITYSLAGAPVGMAIDPSTGEITWATDLDDSGSYEVTVGASDGIAPEVMEPLTIDVTQTEAGAVLFRVNAGGPAVVDPDGDWAVDTTASPSPLGTGGNTSSTSDAQDTSDPTVPVGTPAALFQTERWSTHDWDFPVPVGAEVEVRLYFAETFNSVVSRVFDVSVDGTVVVDDLDLQTTYGPDTGVVFDTVVTSDGNIDVLVGPASADNPKISAIEIREITPAPFVVDPVVVESFAVGDALYRVNAGSDTATSAIDGGIDWGADPVFTGSPFLDAAYVAQPNGQKKAVTSGTTVTAGPTIPSSVPAAVYQVERWDPPSGLAMGWNFPVASGTPVEVRLIFAETNPPTSNPGDRLFDVLIDGELVLDDYDQLDAAGGQFVAVQERFVVVADGDGIDIDLLHGPIENTTIKAIEIVELVPTVTGVAGPFELVTLVTNPITNPDVDLTAVEQTTGVDAPVGIGAGCDPAVPAVLGFGDLATCRFTVDLSGAATGDVDVSVAATADAVADDTDASATSSTVTITVEDPPPAPDIIERINAGGPTVAAIDGEQDWEADSDVANHPTLTAAGSNDVGAFPVGGLDPSVPGWVPSTLFGTERYSDTSMTWEIPVIAGQNVDVYLIHDERLARHERRGHADLRRQHRGQRRARRPRSVGDLRPPDRWCRAVQRHR
ncbi:MAG: malectin domain-containing carbohydrate-binding protein [Actinomycetota bacterium]